MKIVTLLLVFNKNARINFQVFFVISAKQFCPFIDPHQIWRVGSESHSHCRLQNLIHVFLHKKVRLLNVSWHKKVYINRFFLVLKRKQIIQNYCKAYCLCTYFPLNLYSNNISCTK